MGIEEQNGGRGRAVITASSAMEYAFEGDQLADAAAVAPSVFTSALAEGLETGDADRDQDGMVGLDELYEYVHDRVRAATPNQTPRKWTYGVQGDLYIAHRARPVTTPAPLPPELPQAVDHPLTAVRAGAVQELQRRHAGLALAARLTPERLAKDDSRTVSAATPPVAAAPPTAPAAAGDGPLRVAGGLAILGAVVLVAALSPAYQWGDPGPSRRGHRGGDGRLRAGGQQRRLGLVRGPVRLGRGDGAGGAGVGGQDGRPPVRRRPARRLGGGRPGRRHLPRPAAGLSPRPGDSFAVASGPVIAFGLAVLALLVAAVLLGRAAPAGDAEPATRA